MAETVQEGGIVGDDIQDFGGGNFNPAPGVKTVCVFPKNPVKGKLIAVVCPFMKLLNFLYSFKHRNSCYQIYLLRNCFYFFEISAVVVAGQETELLIGLKNEGNMLFSQVFRLLPF